MTSFTNQNLARRFAITASWLGLAAANLMPGAAAQGNTDLLLHVDLNRKNIIETILDTVRADITAPQLQTLQKRLWSARADQLAAARLAGSLEGVLEVMASQPSASPVEGLVGIDQPTRDRSKALGDLAGDLVYVPITPCNLMDTRAGVLPAPPVGGPALAGGYVVRTIQVAGNCTVPTYAAAISAQLTVENIPSTGGVVIVGKAGASGGAVGVSWSAPSAYASGASVVPLSTAGQLKIQSAGTTHVIVDITGYFAAPASTAVQCINSAESSATVAYNTNATLAASCPATYSAISSNCSWTDPSTNPTELVISRQGIDGNGAAFCNGYHYSAASRTLSLSSRCCKVPGR